MLFISMLETLIDRNEHMIAEATRANMTSKLIVSLYTSSM